MQSTEINELADALAKAQGAMGGAKKDSDNPFFKSKYADLAAVIDAGRKALSDNGLSVCQVTQITEQGLILRSTLMHKSGQWLAGELPIEPVKRDPQGIGSAITYMRRYGWQAITGIAAEDDDGNAASQPSTPKYHQTPAPAPKAQPAAVDKYEAEDGAPITISVKVLKNVSLPTSKGSKWNAIDAVDADGVERSIKVFGKAVKQAAPLQPGDWITVDGKWSDYHGKLSITADVITAGARGTLEPVQAGFSDIPDAPPIDDEYQPA